MKKYSRFTTALFCAALSIFIFTGCGPKNGADDPDANLPSGNSTDGTDGSGGSGSNAPETYIGSKLPTDEKLVGDIVFNDGSATPYSKIQSRSPAELTAEEKAAAIAIIFYNGTGLNSDAADGTPDNSTKRILGVGLNPPPGLMDWVRFEDADNYANAYKIKITALVCTPSTEKPYTFTGDKNGSDNFEQISKALKDDTTTTDDTNIVGNYPAFEYCNNYSTEATVGTVYDKKGWFVPTIAELYEIYNEKETVKGVLSFYNKTIHGLNVGYRVSTQSNQTYAKTYAFLFDSGTFKEIWKRQSMMLLPIHEF